VVATIRPTVPVRIRHLTIKGKESQSAKDVPQNLGKGKRKRAVAIQTMIQILPPTIGRRQSQSAKDVPQNLGKGKRRKRVVAIRTTTRVQILPRRNRKANQIAARMVQTRREMPVRRKGNPESAKITTLTLIKNLTDGGRQSAQSSAMTDTTIQRGRPHRRSPPEIGESGTLRRFQLAE
jgi:hypothetical protein